MVKYCTLICANHRPSVAVINAWMCIEYYIRMCQLVETYFKILECAADQLANWKNKSENKKVEIGAEEEGIVYANIIDLIYQIVPLLVPFHTNKTNRLRHHMRSNQVTDGNSSVLTGASYNADDDSDEDEGFNESQGGLGLVHKFMEKIQDRLGIECKIKNDKLNGLSQENFEL